MKILLWPSYYFPSIGGLEMVVRALAKEFRNLGHTTIVFADSKTSKSYMSLVEEIEVHYFPFQAALGSKNPSLIKATLERAATLIQAFSPDVANIHGWYEFFAFFQLRVLKQIPFFLTVHGLMERMHYQTHSCKQLWSQAKGVNVVSNALLHQLSEENWHHPSLRLIYNGIFLPQTVLQNAAKEGVHIAMIGRFTAEKCFDIGLRAFKKLKTIIPDATLCLAGQGDDWNLLTALRKELGLEQCVEMPGFIHPDRIDSIIDRAHLVWIPSLYESFCLVALEAAARGRPVVASDVFGLKEAVEHGKTGLLVKKNDPDSIVEASLSLLQSPQQCHKMGEYANQRVERLFSIQRAANQYVDMYT